MGKLRKAISYIFLFIGFYLIAGSGANITGSVIGTVVNASIDSIIGLVSLIIGSVLFLDSEYAGDSLEKKLSKLKAEINQELKSGRIGTYRELHSYAKRIGCDFIEGKNHEKVYLNGNYITDIPRHDNRKGTYRKILKDLNSILEYYAIASNQ